MKKLNYIKLLLDIVMIIVFTLLFNKMLFGMKFHEVVGLAIGAAVLIHCVLNRKWIKGVTIKLFSKSTPVKTRIMYALNLLLAIDLATIIITGIFISKVVFRGLNLSGPQSFKVLHISAAYILLALIGIHVGLHWNWIMFNVKKLFKVPDKKILGYVSRGLAVLVLAFGIYSFNSSNYISKISIISSNKTAGSHMGQFNQRKAQGNGQKPSGGVKSKPSGNFKSNPPHGGKGREGNRESNNIVSTVTTNLGIVAVFAIPVYYLEKLLKMRKKKTKAKV